MHNVILKQTDPLLMEQAKVSGVDNKNIVDIPSDSGASSSGSHIDPPPHSEIPIPNHEDPSSSMQVSVSLPTSSPTTTNSHANFTQRSGDNYNQRCRSPLNSGLWISFELAITLWKIISSIVILSLSRHEKPQAPLFAWIVGYSSGCVATLPLLCWRFLHRNNQGSDQESASARENNSPNTRPSESTSISISIPQGQEGEDHNVSRGRWMGSTAINARLNVLVDHFKMALDCFFAIWFVVGNVWIFGGHSSAADAPNLYRLCIVFLTFSCIGYALHYFCCCCLPCIISILGFREDLGQTQGASSELINVFPTYKFKLKRHGSREYGDINSDSSGKGGILAAGTDKERMISGEDAVCCICLANYGDNEELRELPCAHYFHVACVDKWLKINASCPLCKDEVCEPTSRTN